METTSLSNKSNITHEAGNNAVADHAMRSIEEARASAEELAARGNAAIRSGTARAQEIFHQTSEHAAHYVQEKPLKALLLAVVAGAAIALLAGGRNKHHGHH
ncbi:MAG: hypothetical protein Q8K52_07135 [Thiobacillus sp.]|nr:hypothetical protein [Thiobacillus sp.]